MSVKLHHDPAARLAVVFIIAGSVVALLLGGWKVALAYAIGGVLGSVRIGR